MANTADQKIFSKYDNLYLLVIIISFPGYPLIAAASTLMGLNNTALSIGMRSVNVFLCIILILHYLNSSRSVVTRRILFLLTLFWSAYLVRIAYDTVLIDPKLGQDASFYWIWSVGGCLIPMLGLALRPMHICQSERMFAGLYLTTLFAAVIAVFATSAMVISDMGIAQETGRMRIGQTLNPISLGYLGATLLILSVWAFCFHRPWWRAKLRILLLSGCTVGFYLLIAANSRGPIVATFVCLVIVLLSVEFRYKIGILIFSVGFSIIVVPVAKYLEANHGITAFSRLFGKTVEDHVTSSSRLDLFASALEAFWISPLVGSALEDPITGSYPHNVIVEAFMALGIVFGTVFVVISVVMCVRAFRIIKRCPQFGWPSLLFFQFFIGAQFSGSLYASTYMWCAIGLLTSCSLRSEKEVSTSVSLRNRSALRVAPRQLRGLPW